MIREAAIEVLKEKRLEINYRVNGTTQFSEALDLAIQALEQESCEDAISRAEALKNLALTNNKDDVYRMIQALPPVTTTKDWIPVSERLPEESGEYLVSLITPEYDGHYEMVGLAWFAHDKDYVIKELRGWRIPGIVATVVAWMPIPETYRAESGDGE